MEVGAVKQAFNNEVILLKKKLNQAKIQIIHKLTRKAKTLTEKKVPDKLKGKFTKKAESAVKEVLIIKKIKARDVARFIVTHKGQLNEYLNRPTVDKDKACARLLMHKSLQDKYKMLRDRFSNISIEDLLMSRQERLKRKKEAREKQKDKKKGNKGQQAVQAEGNWDIEDIEDMNSIKVRNESDDDSEDDDEHDQIEDSVNDEQSENENVSEHNESSDGDDDIKQNNKHFKSDNKAVDDFEAASNGSNDDEQSDNEKSDSDVEEDSSIEKFVRLNPSLFNNETGSKKENKVKTEVILNKRSYNNKVNNKHKDGNKNKNLNNKILMKKFNKDTFETPIQENKIADPFFITATGENYMSVAEPRQPDEVKEVHKQGNRKYRRAVMFGHVPKPKPRRDDFANNKNNPRFSKFDNSNREDNFTSGYKSNGLNKGGFRGNDVNKANFKDRRNDSKINNEDTSKPEKLHPSWEAKKRQSGILPFQGKKIVFDEG